MGHDSGNVGGSDSWEQGLHGVAKGRGGLRGPHLYSLLGQYQVNAMAMSLVSGGDGLKWGKGASGSVKPRCP